MSREHNEEWDEEWVWKAGCFAWCTSSVSKYTTLILDEDGEWRRIGPTRLFYKEYTYEAEFSAT